MPEVSALSRPTDFEASGCAGSTGAITNLDRTASGAHELSAQLHMYVGRAKSRWLLYSPGVPEPGLVECRASDAAKVI